MTAEVPLIPGQAEGWRVWRAVGHGDALLLQSIVFPFVWRPGEVTESWCNRAGDNPCVGEPFKLEPGRRPYLPHKCGLHGFYQRDAARRYGDSWARGNPVRVYVLGRVAGAGRVIEHTDGFRAARAAVLSIDEVITGRDVGHVGAGIIARLRNTYRLGVTLEV